QQTNANRIRIKDGDGTVLSDALGRHDFWPDAVTPTMLAFRMPFDCFAPLLLEVAKRDPSGNRVSATIPLCDPQGCADAPEGTSCGDACHANDVCNGQGKCVPGRPVVCAEPCLRCDPAEGCSGMDAACPSDAKSSAVCRPAAGECDAAESCDGVHDDCPPDVQWAAGTVCRPAAGPCDVDEICPGSSTACPRDEFKAS